MATSQNGFPASADRNAIGVRTFKVPGHSNVLLPIRADIAPLLLEMARWFFANVEPPVVPGCWGWSYRAIRGATQLSNHASGTAIDLNAPRHPLGAVGTVPAAKRALIHAKAQSLGLRWGGDYAGRKDEMHFEINVPLATALALVKRLQSPAAPKPPATKPPAGGGAGGGAVLQRGGRGTAVRELQSLLNKQYPLYSHLTVDGDFGPATESVVKEFQRRSGLTADGVVGSRTRAALGLR